MGRVLIMDYISCSALNCRIFFVTVVSIEIDFKVGSILYQDYILVTFLVLVELEYCIFFIFSAFFKSDNS